MEEAKNAIPKLLKIQQELKAPKGQFNKFGGYKYRSAEDILEAVKPLVHREGLILTISDEMKQVGSRYYVVATAVITNGSNGCTVTAYAREDESQKGMSGAQITGAASSYARKYALNGLFAIDDTKDADATNTHGKGETEKKTTKKVENVGQSMADLATEVEACKSMEELQSMWDNNFALHKNKAFIADVTAKKKALSLQKK